MKDMESLNELSLTDLGTFYINNDGSSNSRLRGFND